MSEMTEADRARAFPSEPAMSWEDWSAELTRVAGDSYGPEGPIGACGEECWREAYATGATPSEAFEMDRSYWDDDGPDDEETPK
jgi:hypothetical protein